MMLGGGLAIYNLPISQYPPIAPLPSISISAVFPGASAKTVEDSVVQIIEQKMTASTGCCTCPPPATRRAPVPSRADLRAGHRSGPGLGEGENKPPACAGHAAGGCSAAARSGQQVHPNYLMIVGLRSESADLDQHDLNDYCASW